MQKVGIVGIGGMGGGVAKRLLEQGVGVVLWNRSKSALDAFREIGAEIAETPAQAAAAGIVISFVANDAALLAVSEGENGILAGLPEDGVHISMSTVSPGMVGTLEKLHSGWLVSAPVFGRPEAAAAGLLWVAMSGPQEARDKVRGVIGQFSRSIHEFGDDPQAAIKAKIAGNFLIACTIESMSEAFAMLEQSGADPSVFHEMMSETIFGGVINQRYGQIILDNAFDPAGFKLSLGGKDVGLARDVARAAGTPLPFGDILADRFGEAMDMGMGELDWNAISRLVRGD